MLGRFEELKSTSTNKLSLGKARNNNAEDSSNDKSKQRRRSLFTKYASKEKEHDGKAMRPSALARYDEQIIDFSSSSDEEQTRNESKLPLKRSNFTEAKNPKLERINKSQAKGKRRRESAPANLPRVDEGKLSIDWSDSNDEWEPPSSKVKLQQLDAELDSEDIDNFDSPKKPINLGRSFSTMTEIDDSTQSQISAPNENYDTKEDPRKVNYCDSSKKRRSRIMKGGLVEQLKKVTAREMSSLVFWQHSSNQTRYDSLDEDRGIDTLTLQILKAEKNFSLVTLICCTVDTHSETYCIMLHGDNYREMKLSIGNHLRVFPPFKKVSVSGIAVPVILCTYFMKNITGEDNDIRKAFDVPDNKSLLSCTYDENCNHMEKGKNSLSSEAFVSMGKQIDLLYSFVSCCYFKPSSFVATVVKSKIVLGNVCPNFSSTCDESIIDVFKTEAKEAKRNVNMEVYFLILDENRKLALLNCPLEKYKQFHIGKLSSLVQTTLIFQNFTLRGIKNAAFDPTILSFYGKLDENEKEHGNSVPCFIFASSAESAILVLGDQKSDEESMTRCNKTVALRNSCRESFFAHCISMLPEINKQTLIFSSKVYSMLLIRLCDLHQTEGLASDSETSLVLLEKLSSCFVPRYVSDCFLEDGQILYLKDVSKDTKSKRVIADSYTEICLVNSACLANASDSCDLVGYGTFEVEEKAMNLLKRQQKPHISMLSVSSERGTFVQVEGFVSGINEETAMFWVVCDQCGEELKDGVTQKLLFCQTCGKNVGRKIHVQLDILLKCELAIDTAICIRLLEKTIYEYLPMDITEDFSGYDIDCIIGKKFGPTICYVMSKRQNSNSVPLIELKEANVAKGFDFSIF
ncbi:uncharacterized protein LOC135694194 [Rhopilema esculentum]|uniref:uncharacterized protein LOC135694194 n=1 Tax=Rhopilema esculentum TaxID=499914 RepID=UPI0031D02AA6|eukprot:gene2760-980_t